MFFFLFLYVSICKMTAIAVCACVPRFKWNLHNRIWKYSSAIGTLHHVFDGSQMMFIILWKAHEWNNQKNVRRFRMCKKFCLIMLISDEFDGNFADRCYSSHYDLYPFVFARCFSEAIMVHVTRWICRCICKRIYGRWICMNIKLPERCRPDLSIENMGWQPLNNLLSKDNSHAANPHFYVTHLQRLNDNVALKSEKYVIVVVRKMYSYWYIHIQNQ